MYLVSDNNGEMLNIAGVSVKWWVVLLGVTCLLFIISITVTVCLFRKLQNIVNHNTNSGNDKVYPLASV